MSLDALDRRILDLVQGSFPVEPRPFQVIADEVGSTEEEVIARMQCLQEAGTIREVGPVFTLQKLGYTSSLCAARVVPESVTAVAEFVNAYDEVTHNYLREDPLNVWFTLIVPTQARMDAILAEIGAESGVEEVLSLPATKLFKIKVQFNTGDNKS
jgi:siroheme decarboxylase